MPNWWLFFLIQEAGTDALLLQHGFLEEGNEPERHGGDDIAFPPCQTVTKKSLTLVALEMKLTLNEGVGNTSSRA